MDRRRSLLAALLQSVLTVFSAAPAVAWDADKASSNLGVPALAPQDLATRKIKLIEMGELQLPTGEIVVADPLEHRAETMTHTRQP